MATNPTQPHPPETPQPVSDQPAILYKTPVLLRANFYRDNYRRLMVICLSLVTLTIGLLGWLFYERTHKPPVHYFATTSEGKLIELFPLSTPNLTTPTLLDWVREAVTTAYNFNFGNYDKELKNVRVYFTDEGYDNFLAALSNTIETVKAKQLVVTAVTTGSPVILKEGPTSAGVYAWQIQVPMLINFQSSSEQIKQNVVLTLLIARRPTIESPKGIGIAAISVKEI